MQVKYDNYQISSITCISRLKQVLAQNNHIYRMPPRAMASPNCLIVLTKLVVYLLQAFLGNLKRYQQQDPTIYKLFWC